MTATMIESVQHENQSKWGWHPCSREKFLDVVWGYHAYPSTRTIDNFITALRGKLEIDPANLKLLYQGVTDAEMNGKPYGQIPWRLGLLELEP